MSLHEVCAPHLANLEVLAQVSDAHGVLEGVTAACFEGDLNFSCGLHLSFSTVGLTVLAEDEFDTVRLTSQPLTSKPDEVLIDVTELAPWRAAAGLPLLWAWSLTNQQGYTDGVRFEFAPPGSSSSVVIELVVVASAIRIFTAGQLNSVATPAPRER